MASRGETLFDLISSCAMITAFSRVVGVRYINSGNEKMLFIGYVNCRVLVMNEVLLKVVKNQCQP